MSVDFRPVKGTANSLSYLAAESIREMIARGELSPGMALPPERQLTEQLGVSRTSLREALKMLESMGMLEARVGRGRFVVDRTEDSQSLALVRNWLHAHREEIEDLNEIRTAVERTAVAGIPPAELAESVARARGILAEARRAVARRDAVRAAELDRDFHRAICGETPNRPLQTLAFGLIDAAQHAAVAVYAIPREARTSLEEHSAIVESLAAGDVAAAQDILSRHFMRAPAIASNAEPRRRA
jgi:GntR family transcriptional regulator, transcriptional repressor for pyruvate dehydrogenase complex